MFGLGTAWFRILSSLHFPGFWSVQQQAQCPATDDTDLDVEAQIARLQEEPLAVVGLGTAGARPLQLENLKFPLSKQ